MRNQFEQTFGCANLLGIFNELIPYGNQEEVLATIFHVIAWQIRLRLLNPNSMGRIGRTHYVREDNSYQAIVDGRGVTISMGTWINVNRRGFSEVSDEDRLLLPDRGVMPPQAMMTMKEFSITGQDEESVKMVCERFKGFILAQICSNEFRNLRWFNQVKQFALKRLIDQNHAWLSLLPEVAKFYDVQGPDRIGR